MKASGAGWILIPALAGLAPEHPRRHALVLQGVGAVARLGVHALEHRLRGGVVHVQPDEVHQLEGAHGEAQAPQDPVDVLLGHALAVQPEGLAVEGAGHPVDQEAGEVPHPHGLLAPAAGELERPPHHRLLGLHRRDDLDELHALGGVEEVQPHHPLRARHLRRDGRDREGGGVGRQHGAGVELPELAQQLLLELELLRHRLDHPLGLGAALELAGGLQAGQHLLDRARQAALLGGFSQVVAHGAQGLLEGLGVGVVEQHGVAGLCGHLRDAAPHGSCPDDCHAFVHPSPLRFEFLCQTNIRLYKFAPV
ncbi:hypothetical protein Mterra_00158 [Calidithermus terrae]|uniref:Uncharacterized protein n=1 Tax=Calidithermus terrae TaxID=1408545 RepID=A0A399F556_9DEIN|nr:hypothetical protein Mterra_00158 [Calidithermus terrae]